MSSFQCLYTIGILSVNNKLAPFGLTRRLDGSDSRTEKSVNEKTEKASGDLSIDKPHGKMRF